MMSGALKRKFEEVDEDPCYSSSSPSSLSSSACSEWESDGEACYSDTQDSRPSSPSSLAAHVPPTPILKKTKRSRKGNVQFDRVTVFFFQRCQGFTSVPSRGGCTLGMVRQHSARRHYTLAEFAQEQRRLRREKLRSRLREEKLEALKMKLTNNGTRESEEAERLTLDDIPEDEVDVSSLGLEDSSFLHPYPSKRRHALLKAAGVKKIDRDEKRQLHDIRLSREDCGCSCQGFCEPETCACSLAGIKCQMDHSSFPCGCTKDGCGNTEGRVEFNSSRVQTHYIHTIMKLELEKRLEESSSAEAGAQPAGSPGRGAAFGFAPEEAPAFHFSPELAAAGENSCSSDMTDSSSSSGQSEDSETAGGPQLQQPQLDVDDNGLARILSFSDSDSEDGSGSEGDVLGGPQQPTLSSVGLGEVDFFHDNDGAPSKHSDNRGSSISDYLDENANQASTLFSGGSTQDYPSTPSPSINYSKSYMDLSLSSDSDLEFFDNFPDYSSGSLFNSLKDYDHLDNFFHFQLPSYPSIPQGNDPGTCFLDSLIGLSESVPEPQTTFADNQLLEEAIKSSMVESVKV
ncbi:cysteine/serine-rich nuclear protein 1-like [Brienomyrus brachyistius]|uniref:cysteine/serine-rich nuclear protein 1-like n=1 Tax=Brienomyrus brachyistius TaxID=42636 RepID=UPI0020B26C8A|nr:cysteine/serine-rich nuclear protein 1-like [Brienomyrus brachyistius]